MFKYLNESLKADEVCKHYYKTIMTLGMIL